jgi:hypothetical protein
MKPMTQPETVQTKAPVPSEELYPPRLIYDEEGKVIGVILAYSDYQTFLRVLARHADWESLPDYLQDAIDHLLADEALHEDGSSIPLEELLKET